MNRHFKTFLLVLGGVTLVGGSAIFAVGCKTIKNTGITREFDLTGKTISNFEFDCDTSDVEFVKSTDSTFKVVYQESEKVYHSEEYNDSTHTLAIKQVDDIKWYERLFTFDFVPKKATIYLPTTEFEGLKVDNSTGNFKVPNDFSFTTADIKLSTGNIEFNANVSGAIKISTSTGDVSLSDNSSKSLNVHRSTGDLIMNNVNVEDDIVLDGSTGKTKLNNVKSASLKITSSTGDVDLSNVKVTGDLEIKSSTGEVEFDDIDFANGSIKTSTGGIEGTLSSPKNVDAETGTGKQKVDSDSSLSQKLIVRSSTGDIIIRNK